jgi:Ca2+-binding EF-hand superfamily protein
MRMKMKTPGLVLLLGLTTAATIQAQEPYLFEEIDVNHNGEISRSEAKIRHDLKNNFTRIDSNGNGTLSVDEYSAYANEGRLVPEDAEIPELGAAPVR